MGRWRARSRRGHSQRVPTLAIHLNRTVNKDGFKFNAEKHLAPVLVR